MDWQNEGNSPSEQDIADSLSIMMDDGEDSINREIRQRPTVRDVVANNPEAKGRIDRLSEAMEFDPEEVYAALERVQEGYDPYEGAKRRPIVDHGEQYVAFGLNGSDWHSLFEFIKQGIDDDEKREYIAKVTTMVISDITGEDWHTQNSVPLILSRNEIQDVLAYHQEVYDDS